MELVKSFQQAINGRQGQNGSSEPEARRKASCFYKTARLIIRSDLRRGGELNPDSECQNADGDWVKCSPGQG